MRVHTIVVLASLLLLSGCGLLGNCSYEERGVTAAGSITEGGVELVSADIIVSALRGSLRWKSFDRAIRGSSLKGHVSSLTLVRAGNPTAILLNIPLDQPSSPLVSSGGMIQRPGEISPNLGGLYEIVAANLALLEITTDLPSQSLISLPLTVTGKKDWYRPDNCS